MKSVSHYLHITREWRLNEGRRLADRQRPMTKDTYKMVKHRHHTVPQQQTTTNNQHQDNETTQRSIGEFGCSGT
jgi:hypothetical protein